MPLFSSPSGICLMLWFCTNWQSLHFLLGTSVMAAVPAFCVLFFMVVKPACWWTISNVLHICSAAESPSANSWIDTAVKQKLDLQDPVKTNPSAMSQRLCLPEGFKCPRSFLLHICYILCLFTFDMLLLLWENLSPTWTFYLILKLFPFLLRTGRTNSICWIWVSCFFFSFLAQTLYLLHILLEFVLSASIIDRNIRFMELLKDSTIQIEVK